MTRRAWAAIVLTWCWGGLFSAEAATVTWTGLGANDNWNTNANWSGTGQPPNFMDAAVVGAPAPTVLNVNGPIQTLQVDSGGLINMLGGNNLTITQGTLGNSGEIVVNSDAVDLLSSIVFSTTTSISGDGKIVLNKPFFQGTPPFTQTRGATIESGNTVTNGSKHTIEGAGRINAPIVNEGTVRAVNPAGGSSLALVIATSHTNNNLYTTSATGTLRFVTTTLFQGAGGRIVADAGHVQLDNATINGGTLESANGGEFSVIGSGGARLQNVTNQATVNANAFLGIDGATFTNNGLVRGGIIRFDGSTTVQGSGAFELNNGTLQTLSPAVFTQAAGHAIRGKGTISAQLVNNGLIEVTPASAVPTSVMTLSGSNKTNNNLIRANAGTQINIDASVIITQDPNSGRILADNGLVQFNTGTALIGGTVESSGTGRADVRGLVSFTDVTVEGTLHVRASPSSQMNILGNGLTNNGLITVNPLFATVAHTMFFDGQANMTLDGTGEIVLNGPGSRAQITVATGKTLTQEFGHTISGFGFINGEFINHGDVIGDSPTNPIIFTGTLAGTNHLENVRVNNMHSIGEGSVRAVPTFGEYQLASTATALFEIGGNHPNDFDRLLGQVVKLDGILALEQIDVGSGVFQPQLGDTFEIVNGSNITGTFDDIVTTGLNPAIKYDPIYTSTTLTLKAIRRYSADFDFDGDVDDVDLSAWETGYGTTTGATYTNGDADEDGDVDGRDFLVWQRQYGSGLGPIIAVPEPTAALLFLLSLAPAFRHSKPRSRNLR